VTSPATDAMTVRAAPVDLDACRTAAAAADAKLGADTVILDMADVLGITGAFVISSGQNDRQVRAIVEEVEQRLKERGGPAPDRIEGLDDARWVLMDYGDFIVHVFLDEARSFYDLEHLWSDVPRLTWGPSTTA